MKGSQRDVLDRENVRDPKERKENKFLRDPGFSLRGGVVSSAGGPVKNNSEKGKKRIRTLRVEGSPSVQREKLRGDVLEGYVCAIGGAFYIKGGSPEMGIKKKSLPPITRLQHEKADDNYREQRVSQ